MARAHRFTDSPVLKLALPAWRSSLLLALFMLGMATLVGRAFWLQAVRTDFLQGKGDSRYRRDIEMTASRGRIVDRNGDVLAVSTPMKSIWAIPSAVQVSPDAKSQLAKLLDMNAKELNSKLSGGKDFVFLKRQLPPDVAEQVARLKVPGVQQDNEYRRFYPAGEMVAHMVGFTGVDDRGLEGVELALENELIGRSGSRTVIRDRRGGVVEDVGSIKPPQDGKDIVLALDNKIQYLAYSQLKQAVATHRARAGSVVVLDARTGEVLALANWPTYNPNNRATLSGAQLRNRAVTDTFEPGSTLKPFTVALALEKGKYRYDTPVNCAPGKLTIGTATISDAMPHGVLTVAQVIQKSSNVGTAKIAGTLSAQDMWGMFDAVGFGKQPKLGFPGEVNGRLRPWKSWLPIEQATMSYGHGISVSLLQLARAYTAFARDGEVLPVSLARTDVPLVAGTPVFSAQTAREIRLMLELAVQDGGTAPKAQVHGYRVAGKTGTAHKLEGGVYANRYISSFVGLAPVSDPRLIVAVMIDEPSAGSHYGGDVAAPVFSAVMSGSLRSYGVMPDAVQVATVANVAKSGKDKL